MNVLIILIPITLLLVAFFVAAYIWSVNNGQFDDLEGPKYKLLIDENESSEKGEK